MPLLPSEEAAVADTGTLSEAGRAEQPGKMSKPGKHTPDCRESINADMPDAGSLIDNMESPKQVIMRFASRQIRFPQPGDVDPREMIVLVTPLVISDFDAADRAFTVIKYGQAGWPAGPTVRTGLS